MLIIKHLTLFIFTIIVFASFTQAQTGDDTLCWQLKSAVYEGDSLGVVDILDTNHTLIDCWSYNEPTALNYAIQNENSGMTELLLTYGANPNPSYYLDYPPLNLAVMLGQFEIAELLILYGAATNNTDAYGFTPLTRAVQTGNLWMADMLIHYGAEVDEKDKKGYTPLDMAAVYNDTLLTRFLIEKGAQQTANAIATAICKGSSEVMILLLPLVPDSTQHQLINFALIQRKKSALKEIKAYGLVPSVKPLAAAWAFKQHQSWSGKDMLLGWNFGIREMRYNTRLSLGFHFRTKPSTVYYHHPSESTLYQLYGTRHYLFLEADKHFPLWQRSSNLLNLSVGGKAGYTGGHFRGSTIKPVGEFYTAYHTSIVMETNHLFVSAGYLRQQINDTPVPKGRFVIEAGFFIQRKKAFKCLQ